MQRTGGPLVDLHDAAPTADGRDVGADRQAAQQRRASVVVRNRLVVGLAFSSGVVDVICFLAFGRVLTAFMTGNIVFLGLGAVSSDGPDVGRVAVSIVAFAAGVLLSARIVSPVQDTAFEVWPRRVSVALSIVAVAQVSFLIGWIATFGHPSTAAGDILVGLSAFAMGIQMDAVRSLQIPEISTTATTATLVSLVNNIAHWSHSSAAIRGLRLRIIVAMAAGAAVGTIVLVHARLYAPVLPLIATVFVVVIASVALKPRPTR
jgi:uncharacterized membrane protein YoaK (UPF0700 family)